MTPLEKAQQILNQQGKCNNINCTKPEPCPCIEFCKEDISTEECLKIVKEYIDNYKHSNHTINILKLIHPEVSNETYILVEQELSKIENNEK